MSRDVCYSCRKAKVMCYCPTLQSFASRPQFVILIHPKESRKAINTGRMAFLSMSNAILLQDIDFTDHPVLNALLQDPLRRCWLLFPGPKAKDFTDYLASRDQDERGDDVFIILDASWAMAKKMYRLSRNLHTIPQLVFKPSQPSRFFIREQPFAFCYSSIETIHYIIDKMGTHPAGEHHRLLNLFDTMVQKQIDYELQEKS
ncbi:MAG: DTW domain-containing protein [Proteobacteria bacterium]|nr:DTW domain-containing protein [Pseudomonadota bacterium]